MASGKTSIFAAARELAARIEIVPGEVAETDGAHIAFRGMADAYMAAVKQAFQCYANAAQEALKPFGLNPATIPTTTIRKAVLAEAASWKDEFKWDFPGLEDGAERVLLAGWAESAFNGCLKEIGR